jgi:ABC-2 type transport system permease protein
MNTFLLEIRNTRKSTVVWTVSVGAVIYLILAFFPSMQTEAMQQLANAKMDGIDPAVLSAMGLSEIPDFTIITNFFGYVLQFITLAIMVYCTNHAVSLLVKEETDGTIEYLYAKPVSRTEIFAQKLIALVASFAFMLVIFAVVTVAGYLSFSDYTIGQSAREAAAMYGAILFVGLIFMSVGVFLSSTMKSSRAASGATIALVFGTFVLGVAGAVVKDLSFLQYLSPMDWIKTAKLMSEGIRWQEWLIGILIILAGVFSASRAYKGRDLLV